MQRHVEFKVYLDKMKILLEREGVILYFILLNSDLKFGMNLSDQEIK